MSIFISIIIPIYNMEQLLERCLKSVREQTYKNFEVILINDGSKDNSESICQEIQKKDSRFRYYKQENGGVSSARNNGIQRAEGEWICFVDPDDYLAKDYLEKMISYVRNGVDIIACGFYSDNRGRLKSYNYFGENCIFVENTKKNFERFITRPKIDLLIQLMNRNYCGKKPSAIGVPWAKLYRTNLIKDNNLYFEPSLVRMQDNIFNMYAFDKAEGIICIMDPLYYYTMEHLNLFAKKYDDKAKNYISEVCEKRYEYLKEKDLLSDSYIKQLFCEETITLFGIIMRMDFSNKANKSSMREKSSMIKQLLSRQIYLEVFQNEGNINCSVIANIRFFLIHNNMIYVYIIFEKIINYIRANILMIFGKI